MAGAIIAGRREGPVRHVSGDDGISILGMTPSSNSRLLVNAMPESALPALKDHSDELIVIGQALDGHAQGHGCAVE